MRVSKELPEINRIIDKLEEVGFTVSMSHDRDAWIPVGEDHYGNTRYASGLTVFSISDDEAEFLGASFCSELDQFSAKRGAQIAFGRAMRMLSEDRGREIVKAICND